MTEQPTNYSFDVLNATDLSFVVGSNDTYMAKLVHKPHPIKPHAVSSAGTFTADDTLGTNAESIVFSAYRLGKGLLIFLAAFDGPPGVKPSTKVTTTSAPIEITAQGLWNDPNSKATMDVSIDGATYRITSRYEQDATSGVDKFEIIPLYE